MHKILMAAIAAFVLLATPQAASADYYTPSKPGATTCEKKQVKRAYRYNHNRVSKTHGERTPGRNILVRGMKFRREGNPWRVAAKCRDLRRSTRTFKRWLAPPRARVAPADVAPTASNTAPAKTGGGYAIPSYIVECESGGDYNARNPSGAYGAYQIMPGTAAAYGCSLATPAGQDACAARIYAREGSAPWVCG